MRISVVCFGGLRERVPGTEHGPVDLDIAEGISVGDLVDKLSIPRSLASMVLIDGDQARFEDPVLEGVEVTLMPPFAGGAS
ncbi:MAG: MoaD/ThiS family protein [Actinomycetota bacterium]